MDNIKIVKHVSGFEIVGMVEEIDYNKRVLIKRGFSVITQQIRATEFGLAIVPICVAAEDSNKGLDAEFDRSDIIGIYTPNAGVIENYQRMAGMILTPPRPKLVPIQPTNHNKHP